MLLDELQQAVFGKSGTEGLIAAAHAYRAFARNNPGVYPLTLEAPGPKEYDLQKTSQALLQTIDLLFASCGLNDVQVIHAIRGFRSLLHGFVMLETSGGFGIPVDIDKSFEYSVSILLQGALDKEIISGDNDGTIL